MTAPEPIEVLLLTGYLGAGKTTLLNRLLRSEGVAGRRVALLINEFGSLGVDGALVEGEGLARFEINKGSVFCVCVKTDFLRALERIAREVKPDLVILEATGVSETSDLERIIDSPGLGERFAVRANLCVVDAATFTKVAPFLRAATSQARAADAIVVNKCDLAGAGELAGLRGLLDELNPRAPRVEVSFGEIPPGFLASVRHELRGSDAQASAPPAVVSASFASAAPVDRAAFDAVLAELGDRLLRLKGNVDFGQGPRFVEVAGGRRSERSPAALAGPPTAFTAIAWRIDRPALEGFFARALKAPPEE